MADLRIATHPAIFERPLATADAVANVEQLLPLEHVQTAGEQDRFWASYRLIAVDAHARGNLVPHAHLVALMGENGVRTLWPHDPNYQPFPRIELREPFADGLGTLSLRDALAAGWRELALYLAAGVVYVAIGVAFPEFLFSWFVAAGVPARLRGRAAGARPPPPPMSWAAHDLEPYVIQKHMGKKVAFVPLLIGSYSPDLLSKWFVYGVGLAGWELKADNPAQFHRGWPGVGFTHSLTFGVLVGLLLYAVFRNKVVAYSFVIGHWAHAFTDMGDTVGTMLFFPFTDHLFAVGAWAYAGQTGRYVDAGAYFSGLGFVWDGVFVVWALLSWRVITRAYFRETIVAADPFWRWAGRYVSENVLIVLYRAVVLLRDRALDGVADLGARRAVVRVRPPLGRPALGAARLRGRVERRAGAGSARRSTPLVVAIAWTKRARRRE